MHLLLNDETRGFLSAGRIAKMRPGAILVNTARGAVVDEVSLPGVRQVAAGALAVVATEALAYHAAWLRTRRAEYDPEVRTRLMLGAFVTGVHYVRAQQARARFRREVDDALARHDVLLAPATPLAAPTIDERRTTLGDGPSDVRSALIRLTRPFNFSGHPAASVPAGLSQDGLPVGLQIVGRRHADADVFAASAAFERIRPWKDTYAICESRPLTLG